jgi:TonB-linked SusC/RagA family outer membrane protein
MRKNKEKQRNVQFLFRRALYSSIKLLTVGLILCTSFFGTLQLAMAQNVTRITGVVKDESGSTLTGVGIMVKGSKTGTLTNLDGQFSIELTQKTGVLSFSYIGMNKKEVPFNGSGVINVVLTTSGINLDEVVAIGYGTMKKRDLTGSVSSIKSEDITLRPGANPMEALQGKVAGLDITRTSGEPGAGVNMQLRGNRSITASGNPLFLIDGLPGDYYTLNPNDIESIEVLKDASSTAIYGASGSNGVVIITTKKGKTGKLSIDLNAYYGYNGWSTIPQMRTGTSYLETKREAYKYVWDATNSVWTTNGAIWQSEANDETIFGTARWATYNQGQFVDWAKEFLRKNAGTQNYSLSISGGNEKTKGYVSFNYTDEDGQYQGDDYKLFSSNMKVDHNYKKWLSLGSSMQASYVIRNRAQDKLENALTTDPLVRTHNDDGTLNTNLGNNVYNLLLNYQPGVYTNMDNNFRINVNPYIEIKPIKGLSLLSRLGAAFNYSSNYQFNGVGSVNYTYNNGQISKAQITQNRSYGYNWENILTYNFKVAKDHDFTLTGVTSWSDAQSLNTAMYQSNILTNNFKWYNFTNDVNTTASSSYSMSKTYGLVGRVNYSYLGKYLLSASVRRDGSSALYYTNQWDNFPAASAAWRISDEKFMSFSKDWLDNLKLRLGWGATGVSSIGAYSSSQNLESNNMSLGGTTQTIYRYTQYLTNPDLRWERSYNTNIGLDATLLKNRIDLSLDYYITNTNGVIYSVSSPSVYGTYLPNVNYQTNINVCQTKNKGFEFTLNTRNIITKDFEWSSSVAFATNEEEIVKLTGATNNYIANGSYTLAIGQPVSSFYNYKLNGVWQIGQEKDAAVFGVRPGDLNVNIPNMTRLEAGVYVKTATDGTQTYYYSDLAAAQKYNSSLTAATSKYSVSSKDYQILGHNSPDWSLGFQNTFKYKNFDLSVYMYMRWGQTISYNMMGWYQPNAYATNASPSRTIPVSFNYWTPTNPSNDFPVMNYLMNTSNMIGFTGLNYVDGSFFKIKNITLGYTLPTKLLKKVSIEKFRLYGTITNPLVVANSHLLQQYDPEMNGSLAYPLTKQVVIGLNVTF